MLHKSRGHPVTLPARTKNAGSNGETMDAVVKNFPKAAAAAVGPDASALSDHVRAAPQPTVPRPSRDQAETAVRTLLAFIGDNPDREGLVETPKRFVNAYEELFAGYKECPAEVLDRTFSETGGYDDLVLVRDIPFYSHCEHHVMPFTGKAHIAYVPTGRVVGLSKIARLIDVYARRLQTQEHLTAQISTAIEEILKPKGAAVMLEAEHTCMSMRGVAKPGSTTLTTKFTGLFEDPQEQARFITMVRGGAR